MKEDNSFCNVKKRWLFQLGTHRLMELNNNIFLLQLTGWFQDLKRVLKLLQSYNFLAGKVTKVNLVVIEDDIDGYKLPIL